MSLRPLATLPAAARIAGGLASLMYRFSTVDDAKALVRARLSARAEMFVGVVRKTIWPYPRSPYRRLLQWAGWTPDRLEAHVRRHGLEETLRTLLEDGVYLTFEELKCRTRIRRGDFALETTEADFNNPTLVPSFEVRTGGTTGQASLVPGSLNYLAVQRGPARLLLMEALGVSTWPVIIWLPRDAGINWWLSLAHAGRAAARWFSLTNLSAYRVPQLHQTMFTLARLMGLTRGLRLPPLEHVPLSGAAAVVDAIVAVRARYGKCVVATTPSAATRLAALAGQRGTDLDRVTLIVSGEPLTSGKRAEVVHAGARIAGRYGLTEFGSVGSACGQPTAIDDVHFMADSFGLLHDRRTLPDGQAVEALILTTLLISSSKILINAESDDFAHVTERSCGCLWGELGFHTHFDTIRSFSKLTGEGATVLGTDCVHILEEVLPREFGGRSTDYQLVEAEDEQHLTRLYLIINPSVGRIDEDRVRARFIEELRDPTRPRQMMPPLWRQAETIRIMRREPLITGRGKLLPFLTQAAVDGRIGLNQESVSGR
jgi:hypothetical protein